LDWLCWLVVFMDSIKTLSRESNSLKRLQLLSVGRSGAITAGTILQMARIKHILERQTLRTLQNFGRLRMNRRHAHLLDLLEIYQHQSSSLEHNKGCDPEDDEINFPQVFGPQLEYVPPAADVPEHHVGPSNRPSVEACEVLHVKTKRLALPVKEDANAEDRKAAARDQHNYLGVKQARAVIEHLMVFDFAEYSFALHYIESMLNYLDMNVTMFQSAINHQERYLSFHGHAEDIDMHTLCWFKASDDIED
jgi:hypothetical protein